MQYNYRFFLLILVLVSLAPNISGQTNLIDALKTSAYNKGHKKGYQVGYQDGIEKGWKEGYAEGFKEGFIKGRLTGQQETLDSLEALKERDDFLIAALGIMGSKSHLVREALKTLKKQRYELIEIGWKEGYKKGYEQATLDRDTICFDYAYDLCMRTMNRAQLVKTDFQQIILYEQLTKLVVGGGEQGFSKALMTVQEAIMQYVCHRLDLNYLEQAEMLQEYQRIHEKVCAIYYQQFAQLWVVLATQGDYQSDFKHCHHMELFVEVINSGICGVVDVVLTYVKNSPMYATTKGFDIGHSCQMIQQEVLGIIKDNFVKVALYYDLEACRLKMENEIKATLAPIAFETRKTNCIFKEKQQVSANYKAKFEMEIWATYTVGIDLSAVSVELDHIRQRVKIHLPRIPKILKEVDKGYALKEITNIIKCVTTIKYDKISAFSAGRSEIVKTLKHQLSRRKLKSIYQANLHRISPNDVLRTPIISEKMQIAEQIVQKIMRHYSDSMYAFYEVSVEY